MSTQTISSFAPRALLLALCAATVAPSAPVEAQDFRLNVEAAGTMFVDTTQSDRFGPGLYLAVRPGLAVGRLVTLQWSYANLMAGAQADDADGGIAHFLSTGIRIRPLATMRPEAEQLGGLFFDVNLGYVRTEDLNRFGFDTGLGYNFQATPRFAVGPFLRYGHIVQPDDLDGQDPSDAQFLAFGVNLAFGPAHQPASEPVAAPPQRPAVCPDAPECPTCRHDESLCAPPPPAACPDYDADGVCDNVDRCPLQAGPARTAGCPTDVCGGEALVVVVQFEYDSSTMPPQDGSAPQSMDPVIDAVADAIAQNAGCRVCIIGHTSSEGTDEYNQGLSLERATAVQSYMTRRNIPASRIPVSAMGAGCQLRPATTLVMNRRVEFHRLAEGASCPTVCVD